MTRFDTAPFRPIHLLKLKDIDSHLYVPIQGNLGVDDTFAIGPRRHMAKYLRGMLGEFSRVFSGSTRCERAMGSEHIIGENIVQQGLPTRHSPLIRFDRYRLDEDGQLQSRRYRL